MRRRKSDDAGTCSSQKMLKIRLRQVKTLPDGNCSGRTRRDSLQSSCWKKMIRLGTDEIYSGCIRRDSKKWKNCLTMTQKVSLQMRDMYIFLLLFMTVSQRINRIR